jgi:hypothetical protein
MSFIRKMATSGAYTIGTIIYLILGIAGAAIHLWTILIAFGSSGFISALITFFAPVASQFYWAYYSYEITHTIFNTYLVTLAAYIAMWLLFYLISLIACALSPDN